MSAAHAQASYPCVNEAPPPVRDAKLPPPEGVAADSRGNIYAGAVQDMAVYKYVRQ